MSEINVSLKDNVLLIEKNNSRGKQAETIHLDGIEYGKEYKSSIIPTNSKEKDKIFLHQNIETTKTDEEVEDEEIDLEQKYKTSGVIVYSKKNAIYYIYADSEKVIKKVVKLKYKVLHLKLSKRNLKIKVLAYIENPYNLKIENQKFYIDGELYKECNLNQYKTSISKLQMLKGKNIKKFKFNVNEIIKDESIINGAIRFCLNINGNEVNYKIGIHSKVKEKKYYNLPMQSIYVKDFAMHLRRTIASNLVLVKRKTEPIEKTIKFKIFESKFISAIMYKIGKFLTKHRRKKINLFYEKFASKAEEGVFDLCQMCQNSKNTKNYFVIDKNADDYQKIKENKHIIKKYTFKYYWLIYNTYRFIASEAPSHLNILRSNNKYFRKATYDKKFIFLQHGIIYMKNLGTNSTFLKGKEGESEYIVASSEKEKDVIVDMLKYDEEQILKTGLGMYSKIKYKHINKDSDDYITVMLTWKPYEEQLYNFEESSYYKNTIELYKILQKYINKEKIIIIPHPKAYELLINTDLKDALWKKPISKALEKTKLLITDYSSICYNSFYQGAGVIFYQPDLELYEKENGLLIPSKDEYIGKRVFDIKELEDVIENSVKNKKINLEILRTKHYEDVYKTINEFFDGKNIERIYTELVEKAKI